MKKMILLAVAVAILVGCEKQAAVENKVDNGQWKKCPEFLGEKHKDKKCTTADFDGDGKNDIVIYDPVSAKFHIISSK